MSPKGWKTYKLSEFAEVQNGYAFKSDEFAKKGIPVIKIKNLVSPNVVFEDVQYFNGKTNDKLRRFFIKENDILISMTGSHINQLASAVGKIARYKFDYPALLNQRVGKIYVTDGSVCDEDYLFYFLNRIETQVELASSAGGSANQANISPSQIKDLSLLLPPLPTQRRIAAILSALDEKIELNRQTNATLEAIAQAIFNEWFVDFNFPGATGEMVESELGMIPNGWSVGTVSDILKLSNETITPGTTPESEFFHFSIPAFDSGHAPVIESGASILSNKFKVRKNSILISKLNPRISRVWPVMGVDEKKSVCSTEFQVLLPTKSFFYAFAVNLFSQQSVIEIMKSRASGTSGSHQRIKPQDILDIQIEPVQ